MTLAPAHARFRQALVDAGWQIGQDSPLSDHGGPNPSRLHIKRGRLERRLLVYAWNITSEGTGRKKAGREDLDWRVQTTRSHEGDLLAPPGHLPVGLGWFQQLGVFAAFDVWVKRTTGRSSSAHFSDALLHEAADAEWAEQMRPDGPTCSFVPGQVDRFLSWLLERNEAQVVPVDPIDFATPDPDHTRVEVDPRKDWRYFALRPNDYLVLCRNKKLLDRSLWRIERVETDRRTSASGSNRPYLYMDCRRHGIVRDEAWITSEA
jgi:hypothetical protein